jgi:hypothetical protein
MNNWYVANIHTYLHTYIYDVNAYTYIHTKRRMRKLNCSYTCLSYVTHTHTHTHTKTPEEAELFKDEEDARIKKEEDANKSEKQKASISIFCSDFCPEAFLSFALTSVLEHFYLLL